MAQALKVERATVPKGRKVMNMEEKVEVELIQGHALEELKKLKERGAVAHLVVTSPPYYGLRAYGTEPVFYDGKIADCPHEWAEAKLKRRGGNTGKQDVGSYKRQADQDIRKKDIVSKLCTKCDAWVGELGHEPNVELFIDHLVQIFREVGDILHPMGSLWVVINDTYAGSGGAGGEYNKGGTRQGRPKWKQPKTHGIKKKSLMGVPYRFATTMIEDGWILRDAIIWNKPNPVPQSAFDRFTRDYEHVFMFVKQSKYYYATYYEDMKSTYYYKHKNAGNNSGVKPKRLGRSTWVLPTASYKGAHVAVFPEKLVDKIMAVSLPPLVCAACLAPYRPVYEYKALASDDGVEKYNGVAVKNYEDHLAQDASATKKNILESFKKQRTLVHYEQTCRCSDVGTRGAVVLDPFMGSGTVGALAVVKGASFIGIDVKQEYVDIAKSRIEKAY